MGQHFKQCSLLAIVIGLALVSVAVVVIHPREVNGQLSGVRRWNPRRAPADAVFIGDKACGECHKKHFASYSRSGMAEAMEPVAGLKC